MPHHRYKTVSGKITHVFGHRFVIKAEHGDLLADLTPKGVEQIALRIDDDVTLDGEMKSSELKVTRLTRDGNMIRIDNKNKHHDDHHPHADPSIVLASAHAAGFEIVGLPRRKPKHFELLGRKRGEFSELHIELDGHIRMSKPVAKADQKWSSELRGII